MTPVLVGAKRVDRLGDNLGATDLILSTEDLKLLDEASKLPPIYPRWMSEVDSADRFNPFREIIADRRLR
ncbi:MULTISPECIES: hypothetical protein [Ralstonia solanacearum species complex]|uniref:Aldo/keto reductase n=1 Tax=Ralstonia syzygii TaxID=28097 RepID=A0ABX7ZG35_9RALS|nr:MULTISPECIES: hypothetical protein [Ralstonia solanacearum species complex]BEU72740.1 hypothetical protein MAFF211271_22950 [Ralstonia pseudosolanacearum]AXV77577.1 hypothetical protein CJO76_11755 [Ralstonia solanacearum]AXV91599.1 hypothetical protein CJO79_11735 [Ralstonia solanacearum]AXW06501.1 hypothetical protein CJO82_11995 [Ralstonia solanacearum]AXW19715.1 hypothetical protein CJO85_11795 [Ralstonia solanacearum]